MRKKIVLFVLIFGLIILLKYTESMAVDEIPKVYFEGNITNMLTKEDEREIILKYRSTDINFNKYTKIKIQGTSSLAYEKKNYTINIYEDEKYTTKEKVDVGQGWGPQSKYCLKANWIDKTHSRNIVSARIAAKVQEKYELFTDTPHNGTIDGFPVEIYANDEFLGLYTWNIPKDEWLWNMDSNNQNNIVIAGADNDDIVGFKEEISRFQDSNWEVEVGEENQENVKKLNRLINFIKNSSDKEFIKNFEKYINKDAALNYLTMLYLIEGFDNARKNLMLVTYDGEIWYPSLYDLDTTFGTWHDGTLSISYRILPEDSKSILWLRILKCFPNEVADRWFELRKDIYTKENIIKEFNGFINSIPKETYQKDEERWKDIPGYGIDQIEEFLDFRLPYIDKIMKTEYSKNIEETENNNKEETLKEEERENQMQKILIIVIAMIIIMIFMLSIRILYKKRKLR